jgi:hypothetical protein
MLVRGVAPFCACAKVCPGDVGAGPLLLTTMSPGGIATISDRCGDPDVPPAAIFAGTTTNNPIVIAVIAIAARLHAVLGIAMS